MVVIAIKWTYLFFVKIYNFLKKFVASDYCHFYGNKLCINNGFIVQN